ncbi:TIGR03089 family protein [Cellulomonas sp. PhB143]|uniref:TIGR03089 family protein n=1 Tax=Cellulomonas sp. PhB143 TaxID=2485186 RepID=UPI000F48FFB7|nr:TIGR03089 family protein [Cellulomonas sp. PhB143]ROS78571.1 uncharacterized protein (TIGR03089 family) [Cellulomonas sp. PhB143]
MPAFPASVATLLQALSRAPGAPRITWYGDDGERIELSGAVLENWVSKCTNLLVEELDAAPGTRVVLDLPAHWRSLVWALAAWRCGATLTAAEPADVVVTTRPDAWSGPRAATGTGTAEVVAVALPALARRFDGDLPPGAIDAASAVMTYGDRIGWAPDTDPASPALDRTDEGDGDIVVHRDLIKVAARTAGVPDGARVLLDAGAAGPAQVLLTVVGVLAGDGSVVLVSPATAGALRADAARRARLVDGERVTLDLLA